MPGLKSRIRARGGRQARVNRALSEDADTPRIVDEAIRTFGERYSSQSMPPVVVVIAALNEEGSIGPTLDEIPGSIGGLDVRPLVVDDGSTDRTAEVAEAHGALVCSLSRNRGQGTATRTGYRIAREGGGKYIATVDADGQWDPRDLPAMVGLLESGEADLALGSRQLGRTENTDAVRNLGVRFFSWLVNLLTGASVTDTSSGLRCMRAEVTERVQLTQPQYQAAEFLIGAVCQRFRVAEVPTIMRARSAGESKKGQNLLYGVRYSYVILSTWRRERRRANAAP